MQKSNEQAYIAAVPMEENADYPLVDVVLLSWNRAELTVETIDNVLAQKDVQVNIWIVDQGSSPDNLSILREKTALSTIVHLHELGKNVGVPAGRNIATRLGEAPYVVCIDNDAIFESLTALRQIVEHFKINPNLGVIGFRIKNYFSGEDDYLSWVYPKALLNQREQTFLTTRFCGCGHSMLRTVFDQAGGYDDDLFFYWEEVDFSNRVINLGYSLIYFPQIVVLHKISPEQRVRWDEKRYYFLVRNAIYMNYKYNRSLRKSLILIAGYFLKGCYNGLTRQTINGIRDAWGMCKKIHSIADSPNLHFNENALNYLRQNELIYRGSLWSRIKNDVFVKLPGQG